MARTRQQNEQMRENRTEKIREAALAEFAEKGLFATRIQDIAARAGMARGLLYHYYSSKDAIFTDMIDDALSRTIEASENVRARPGSAREKIRFSLETLLNTIEKSERYTQTCRLIAQATNSSAIPEETQKLIEEKRDIPYRILAEIMEEGQREGSVKDGDPMQLAILFWTSVNGLSIYKGTRKTVHKMPDSRMLAALFLKEEEGESK